jgi:Na+/H+ antiporter NhaD/arsenite permease-like protein
MKYGRILTKELAGLDHCRQSMSDDTFHTTSNKPLLALIAAVAVCYAAAIVAGWPQRGAELVAGQTAPRVLQMSEEPGHEAAAEHPPYWMVTPFAGLLLAIAVFPLMRPVAGWWDSNLHKLYVSILLGGGTLVYYLLFHEHAVVGHWPVEHPVQPSAGGLNFAVAAAVLENAVLFEFIPFIVLLLTLYTVSGGLRIEGDLPAHPLTNSTFLAAGAILANLIGTTGAAMVLIRPLLETNRERRHIRHTVVFFIFVVCNCGGCLLPLGDPPLFLGYLMGVPFLWTLRLWPAWLFVNGLLVGIYYCWDRWWWYPREQARDIAIDEARVHRLRFAGVWPNVPLLLGVVLAIMLLDPAKAFPGTAWHPWIYLRELVQLLLIAMSLLLGSPATRRQNRFSYHAILEVAALFLGIFLSMQAPLQILHVRGPTLGLSAPAHFFWAAGSLSSVLDNAPTYVVFFETARSLGGSPAELVAGTRESLLVAISLGAVFMGAMTYIGNGPNFMVKAIAEKSGVAMPSFFGYLLYSVGVLVPLFVAVTFLFFR